jgi:hypothetical protein
VGVKDLAVPVVEHAPARAADRFAHPAAVAVGPFDANGLRVLERAECLRLLEATTFGRIALTVAALPVVLPVNYRLVGEEIVIRTTAGTKLAAAANAAVVAFEIDGVDPVAHTGWSVMVTGTAEIADDERALARYRSAGIPRWARGGEERFIAIDTELVTGRSLGT